MMHWWICLLPFAAAAQAPPTANALATLDGQAIQCATQEPVLKARVTLESRALVATTDGVGYFRFADIQPGTYSLTVEKFGFLEGSYGKEKPTDGGSLLKLSAGDGVEGVILRLFPAATVSGRVVDSTEIQYPEAMYNYGIGGSCGVIPAVRMPRQR